MTEFNSTLESLRGIEENFHTTLTEPWMVWMEHEDLGGLSIVSTSGLLRAAHQCGYELVKQFETQLIVSVVTNSSISHVNPCLTGSELTVRIGVDDVRLNDVFFSGEFRDSSGLIATFKFVRRFISLEYLGRRLSEKA